MYVLSGDTCVSAIGVDLGLVRAHADVELLTGGQLWVGTKCSAVHRTALRRRFEELMWS